MILSSCGCKVSWLSEGDAAPAGASLACVCYPHSKSGVVGILALVSNPAAHGSGKSTGFSRTIHLQICGFFDGDGGAIPECNSVQEMQ